MFWDPTYILVLIGAALSLIASANIKNTYNKYSKVISHSNITAFEAAERVLRREGIYNVRIESVAGNLTDHYDPRGKVLRLSQNVYFSTSVAAIGVAVHECGHAIQDNKSYAPLRIRGAMVPVVNIAASVSWPLVLLGLIIGATPFINIGIILFALVVLFQLITLPVEFDASNRALKAIESGGILYAQELKGAKTVLTAAALTYVAGLASSVLQLVRLILISGGRSRD